MKYDLVQYGCNMCGKLTDVLDVDQPLPKGWKAVTRFTHVCPQCVVSVQIGTVLSYVWIRKMMEKGGEQ